MQRKLSATSSWPGLFRAFAIAGLVTGVVLASAQSYSITDLGALPGGTYSAAYGINDRGDVVGASGTTTLSLGYIWTHGEMRSIGSLAGGNPGSGLFAINGLGQAVGVANPGNISGSLQTQGIIFRNNTMATIDTGAQSLYAHNITDLGVIIGDYNKGGGGSSGGVFQPAFWIEDPTHLGRFRRTDLAPLAGDTAAYANAGNQFAVIVGYTQSQFTGTRGCLWNNDSKHTPTLLAPLPGNTTAVAYGINNVGVSIGYSWYGIYSSTPTVWSADSSHTPTALPLLPGHNQGWARAINDRGDAIGYSAPVLPISGTIGATPVVWLNGQVYPLQSLLDASGIGWTNVEGIAINNLGQITGNGTHNGLQRAFVMTPTVP